jgi:protoheme IX farnesyltransferase
MNRVYEYGVLLKPKVLLAMVTLYAVSFFSSYASSSGNPFELSIFLLGFAAVAAAVSGSNSLNCYIDRDIDAVMARTWGRPLALGTIGPSGAITVSIILLISASFLSFFLGLVPFMLFLEGVGFYILVYTFLLKRNTVLNILATAPSVAAPVWFGWHLGGAPLIPVGLLMGILVAIWGPLHLWSLAYAYSKDYLKVKVPMLPAVVSQKKAAFIVTLTLALLVATSYLLIPWASSLVYPITISITNAIMMISGLKFYSEGTYKEGWKLFKLTAPYIITVLLSYTIDKLVYA